MTAVESKFKVGDKVKIGKNAINVLEGTIYTVEEAKHFNGVWIIDVPALVQESYAERGYSEGYADFTLATGIARPILTERKVGKVQMDLFDSGFPNAITEVAKVMTWAAENKGYKPHDWKTLPNAETEFSAAASRHRVKGFIQKAEGIAAIDRTDEESNIVHLAHTAFNILAELELVLTGSIK